MVKLTKEGMKTTLGKANIGIVGLQTVHVEKEAVINCRPLTYVGAFALRQKDYWAANWES